MINNKPVIGIVSKHFKENKSILIDTYIRDEIKQAVFDNGGTTYDIPNPEKHDRLGVDYVHSITIDENSKFYNIVKTKTMKVNSRHKRCVKDCPSLDIVGVCEDGYPDVIESKDKKFYIGVRFHPESLYKKDEKHNLIFKEFIEVCKN